MTDTADTEYPASPQGPSVPQGERIAKLLARAGVASRREIERMIADGRVALNGVAVTTPATLVASPAGLTVDGKPVRNVAPTQIWKLHKPTGLVTTSADPEGRPTIFSVLPKRMPRVITVGRLDLTTEGLLLLTNDGALARWLELPQHQVARRYRVRVYGVLRDEALDELRRGVTIEGVQYGPVDIAIDTANTANAWLTVTLREGKNREIRKLMQHAGLTVNRLIRTDYGPFSLGKLERGMVEPVAEETLRHLLPDFFGETRGRAGDGDAPDQAGERPRKPTQNRAAWARNKPKANKPNAQKKRAAEASGQSEEERRAARPKTRAPERVKNRPLRPAQSRGREQAVDDRPRSDKPRSDKPRSERSRDERPRSDHPRSERPAGGKPGGGKPGFAGRPSGRHPSGGPRGKR